jgi:hypothetical protein
MTRVLRNRALALTLFAGAAACDASATRPPVFDAGLALQTSMSVRVIAQGQSATATHRLRNISSNAVTVQFGGCGPLPYVKDSRGTIVHPAGGGWNCPELLRVVTLAPGEEISRTDQLRAGRETSYRGATVTLPPGRYGTYADVQAFIPALNRPLELQSDGVQFWVRE